MTVQADTTRRPATAGQEGKAESVMNALKSMMKATARVRRDGAGDQVIDESVLTGESTPAANDAVTLVGDHLGPGDQTNMAFMNTPVTHGSGTMIVTGMTAAWRPPVRSSRRGPASCSARPKAACIRSRRSSSPLWAR